MLSFKDWILTESTEKVGEWTFVISNHLFDRMSERTQFSLADQNALLKKIVARLSGLRPGEYGFHSKSFNKIFICEVIPMKKQVRMITVLNGNMKLKQGTSKIVTEIAEYIEIE